MVGDPGMARRVEPSPKRGGGGLRGKGEGKAWSLV